MYRIEGIKANREYVVSVRGYNRMGLGFPVYETIRTKRKEEMREESMGEEGTEDAAPMELRANTLSPTSILLTWTTVSNNPNIMYIVKYNAK